MEEEEEEEEEKEAANERGGDKAGVAFAVIADEEEHGGSPPVRSLRFRPGPFRLAPCPPPPSLPLPSSLPSSTRSMTPLLVFADFDGGAAVSPEVLAPLGG